MKTTASLHLLTMMIQSQQITLSTLGNYHSSLNESENCTLSQSAIMLAVSTVKNLDDLITTLYFLDTPAANEVERLLCAMANAVEVATRSWPPGKREKLMRPLLKSDQQVMSRVMSLRKMEQEDTHTESTKNSRACRCDPD